MGLEGEIVVTIARDASGVRRAGIASTRPDGVSRVLVGRCAGDAVALVPRLFAICAHGQGAAAAEAVGAAEGRSPSRTRAARGLAVAIEAVQEDLWRLLVDWPPLAGVAADVEALARVRKSCAPLLDALATDANASLSELRASVVATLEAVARVHVLGESAETFLARGDEAALRAWAAGRTTSAALLARTLLARPSLGASGVRSLRLDRATVEHSVLPALDADAGYARCPHLEGEPRETGALDLAETHGGLAALARSHGSGACMRLFARLVQLAASLEALRRGEAVTSIDAWSPRPDEGVALVRTARGTLMHRARVADGGIARYAIVAPTEWTFHPRGAVARALERLEGDDAERLLADAALVVRLADACVPARVELADA